VDNIIISLIGFFGFFILSAIVNILKSSIKKHKSGIVAATIGSVCVSAFIGLGYYLMSIFPDAPEIATEQKSSHTVGSTIGSMSDQMETMASMMTSMMSLFALLITPIILLKVYRYAVNPQPM
jgi:hypothetical protein